MRNMSFALTIDQIKNQTKTVTRRFAWNSLKPGDYVQPVIKTMGLKKGEKVQKLGCLIKIISVRKEPLNSITQEECIKEGFPDYTPEEFVSMLIKHCRRKPDALVNRIEFEYTNRLTL